VEKLVYLIFKNSQPRSGKFVSVSKLSYSAPLRHFSHESASVLARLHNLVRYRHELAAWTYVFFLTITENAKIFLRLQIVSALLISAYYGHWSISHDYRDSFFIFAKSENKQKFSNFSRNFAKFSFSRKFSRKKFVPGMVFAKSFSFCENSQPVFRIWIHIQVAPESGSAF
jgi:hypothetical protein